jgi:hypothetical protein
VSKDCDIGAMTRAIDCVDNKRVNLCTCNVFIQNGRHMLVLDANLGVIENPLSFSFCVMEKHPELTCRAARYLGLVFLNLDFLADQLGLDALKLMIF